MLIRGGADGPKTSRADVFWNFTVGSGARGSRRGTGDCCAACWRIRSIFDSGRAASIWSRILRSTSSARVSARALLGSNSIASRSSAAAPAS
jgi:hypothetical protein